jgi:uncharacterized membrane protein YkvA (DUF1232 family)
MVGTGGIQRAAADARHAAASLVDPRRCYASKIILFIGLGYPFGPVDIIPNRLPVVGYLDQMAFVVGGIALAYRLLPGAGTAANSAPPLRPGRVAAWIRAVVLDGFAAIFAVPILRLATGAWPSPSDVGAFRHAFRRFMPLPPLMRALATVPAGREQLTRAMLASWLLADESYHGRLRDELGAAAPFGDRLRVWSGPPVTFLHFEKTAGMSMVASLAAQFHPLQIDADPRRAHPPHLFSALPPFLLPRVQRCMLVWGHYDLPAVRRLGAGRFTFTMLREPRARIRSLYRYWRGQVGLGLGWDGMNQPVLAAQQSDFVSFLQNNDPMVVNYIDNFYVRRLTGQYVGADGVDPLAHDPAGSLQAAFDALRSFNFVGLTEDTDGSLAILAERLGFAAPAAKHVNVTVVKPGTAEITENTPKVRILLVRLTSLDESLYAAAADRYWSERKRLAPDVAAE